MARDEYKKLEQERQRALKEAERSSEKYEREKSNRKLEILQIVRKRIVGIFHHE